MSCTCPSQGANAVYLVEPGSGPYTFDASSERYALRRCTLRSREELELVEATIGGRQRHLSQVSEGNIEVNGEIEGPFGPTPQKRWMERTLGSVADGSGDIAPAVALPEFAFLKDTGNGRFQYENCIVNQGRWVAESGQSLNTILSIIGKTFTQPVSTPSVPLLTTEAFRPFAMKQAALTVAGVDYCFDRVEVIINNNAEAKFFNSETAECISPGQRVVQVRLGLPWDSNVASAIYGSGKTGSAIVVDFVRAGGEQMRFTMPKVVWPDPDPEIVEPGDIEWLLEGEALADNANDEITVRVIDEP